MKLQKFFRENQKLMMGVLGAVLVVAWLLGDALTALLQPTGGIDLEVKTRFGTLSGADFNQANTHGEYIRYLDPFYRIETPVDGSLPSPPLDLIEWIVLDQEARSNGLAVPSDAVSWQLEDANARTTIDQISHTQRVRKEHLFEAFARRMDIQCYADVAATATVPSVAEARQLAHRALEKAKVHVVTFPATAFEDENATFSDEELQKQFEAYKDSEPGAGLDFGYVLEDAVRVEYLEIDRAVVQENMKIDPARIERDAKRFWEENRTHSVFRRPEPEPESADDSATSESAEDGAKKDDQAAPPPTGATSEDRADKPGSEKSEASEPAKQKESGKEESAPDPATPEPRGGPSMTLPQEGGDSSATKPAPEPQSGESAPASQEPAPKSDPPATATPAESSPAAPQAPPQPVIGEQGAQPPGAPKPPVFFTTWEEAREAAIEHMRKQKAQEISNAIVDALNKRLDTPWLGLKAGEDGYKPAPPEVKAEDYLSKVATAVEKEMNLTGAIRLNRTGMFTRAEAGTVPGIGTAVYFQQGRMASDSLANLAFTVQGLTPIPQGGDRYRYLSLYQPSRYPLVSFRENKVYLFRVVEVRPSRPPQSLDEVRDRVVKDLRLKAGYEAAQKRAEGLVAAAGSSSLKEAYEADTELSELKDRGVAFHDPPPFSLFTLGFRGDLSATPFVSLGSAGSVPADTAKKIFALAGAESPRTAVPLESRASVLVVEWKETLPAREDALAQYLKQQAPMLINTRARSAKLELTRPSNVRARNGLTAPDEGA